MKIALITGASSGIGREFAVQIAKLYRNIDEIWVTARREERLEQLKKELDVKVKIYTGNLCDDEIYNKIEAALKNENIEIRMLVNAAGYGKMEKVDAGDPKEQCGMLDVNCRALTRMTMLCIPFLSSGSRIVNIASAAAFCPQPGFAVYAASKSYVYSFSLALGAELEKRSITVTTVCPGPVDTEFFERAGALPSKEKAAVRASASEVVKQALLDSVNRKTISVYGMPMKCARIFAGILSDRLLTRIMKRINHIN